MNIIRIVLATLVAMAGALVVAAPANAYYAPPSLSATATATGGSVAVSATSSFACETYTVKFRGQTVVGSGTAVSANFTAPTKPGTYTGTAKCKYVAGAKPNGKPIYGTSTTTFSTTVQDTATPVNYVNAFLAFLFSIFAFFFGLFV